jgi:mRNA interferase HigB
VAKDETNASGASGKSRKNHLISRKKFREFIESHLGSLRDADTILHWCKTVERAAWLRFSDIKATFRSADQVGPLVVFNVGGGKYRVIASVRFKRRKSAWVYIKYVLTHSEYSDDQRKNSP